jgi:hypothetical protein
MLLAVAENVVNTLPIQTISTTLTWLFGVSLGQFGIILAMAIYIFTNLKNEVKDIKESLTKGDENLKTELNSEIDKKASAEKVDGNFTLLMKAIEATNDSVHTTNQNVERLLPLITSVARIEGKLEGVKEIVKEVTPR